MKKSTDYSNHDRFVDLGLIIAALRKRQGLSQEKFAEKADIARSTLSAIEAANNSRAFSVDTPNGLRRLFAPPQFVKVSAFPLTLW